MKLRIHLIVVATLAFATSARADRPVSVGPYAEIGVGGTGAIGDAGRYAAVGPAFALRAGSDLWSWLSIGGRLSASIHEATVPPPPEDELFQLYSAAAEARLTLAIGRIGLYADGSLGFAYASTDILAKVDILDPGERMSPLVSAGGGLEYQLQNRHYAFGLGGQWTLHPAFDAMQTVEARGYLRYTY